ncbi:heavy-metal-associated domain-containing protein [Actinomyces sp. zg328]|uniref:heavy-metal-associated domain-containing protein n=1 Tax=Actinomyces sp. zg328 TaxID=2609287 RepID=UPI00135CD428|nr:heavy-metal-associated domain-containing protein [Actinomyces sp. zg328]
MADFTDDGIDRTTTLKVSGLTCGHCVSHVTEELEALTGVKDVSIVLNKGGQSVVTVVSDVVLEDAALAEAIDEAGDYTLDAVERDVRIS